MRIWTTRCLVGACVAVFSVNVSAEPAERVGDANAGYYTLIDNVEQNIVNAVADDGTWVVGSLVMEADALISLNNFAPASPPSGTVDAVEQSDGSKRQLWLTVAHGTEHIIELYDEQPGPLDEVLVVAGLDPRIVDERVVLSDADGVDVIEYSHLSVFDSMHRLQTSWFDVEGSEIHIRVELADDAIWPIVIDPIVTAPLGFPCPASVCQSESFPMRLGGNFGTAIATGFLSAGPGCTTCDVTRPSVAVGVPFIEGSFGRMGGVALFSTNTSGQLVFDSFHQMESSCGFDVEIGDVDSTSDNDVIVGCPNHDGPDAPNDGSIQVHFGPGMGGGSSGNYALDPPYRQAIFLQEDRTLGVDFEVGRVMNGPKDVIVATQNFHHGGEEDRFLLYWPNLNLTHDATIAGTLPLLESNGAAQKFSTVILNIDDNAELDVAVGTTEGVRLFVSSGSGLFVAAQEEISRPTGDPYGAVRVTAGDFDGDGDDDLIVGNQGAFFADVAAGRGEVVAFKNVNGTFDTANPQIVATGQPDERLGSAVFAADFNGDRIEDLVYCGRGQGTVSARCIMKGGQVARPGAPLINPNARMIRIEANTSGFGEYPPAAADFAGDQAFDLLLSSPNLNTGTTGTCPSPRQCGAISRHAGTRAMPVPALAPEGNAAYLQMGAETLLLEDLDGDGFDEMIVGTPALMQGTATVGAVRIYRGGTTMSSSPSWVVTGNTTVTGLGRSISVIRYPGSPPSLLVSAINNRVYVFPCSPGSLPAGGLTAQVSSAVQNIGVPVISDENVTTMANSGTFYGQESVAIGATGKSSPGSVYVYGVGRILDGSSVLAAGPLAIRGSVATLGCGTSFGGSVAGVGDVGGDSREDLLIGGSACGTLNEGRAFLYLDAGSASPGWQYENNVNNARTGVVAALGDIDGDEIADFGVGAPSAGVVYTFKGVPTGLPSLTPTQTIAFGSAGFGSSIGGGRDYSGDGLADLVVGAPSYSIPATNVGRIMMYRTTGSTQLVAHNAISGTSPNEFLGAKIAVGQVVEPQAGNLFGDLVFSSPGFGTAPQVNEGKVSIRMGQW